jgi:hypothetical protein
VKSELKQQFSEVVKIIIVVTQHRLSHNNSNDTMHNDNSVIQDVILAVPTTVAFMRAMITEGKHSVVTNLPRPAMQKVGRHSYMS